MPNYQDSELIMAIQKDVQQNNLRFDAVSSLIASKTKEEWPKQKCVRKEDIATGSEKIEHIKPPEKRNT